MAIKRKLLNSSLFSVLLIAFFGLLRLIIIYAQLCLKVQGQRNSGEEFDINKPLKISEWGDYFEKDMGRHIGRVWRRDSVFGRICAIV